MVFQLIINGIYVKNNCTTSNLKNGRESCGRNDVHNKSDTACSTISMR